MPLVISNRLPGAATFRAAQGQKKNGQTRRSARVKRGSAHAYLPRGLVRINLLRRDESRTKVDPKLGHALHNDLL